MKGDGKRVPGSGNSVCEGPEGRDEKLTSGPDPRVRLAVERAYPGVGGGRQWSQPTGICGPGDTLHSSPRAVGTRGKDFNQSDGKVRCGFRTFWIGRSLSCELTPARAELEQGLRWSRGYVNVPGEARSERASWRRRPEQRREALSHPAKSPRARERQERRWLPSPAFLLCLHPQLTVDGHLVQPAGLAQLTAGYTLEQACVLGAGGCQEQGVGGQEPGTDRRTERRLAAE